MKYVVHIWVFCVVLRRLTFTTTFHIFSLVSWEHDNWIAAKLCIECPWHGSKHIETKLQRETILRLCSLLTSTSAWIRHILRCQNQKSLSQDLPSCQVILFKDKCEEWIKKFSTSQSFSTIDRWQSLNYWLAAPPLVNEGSLVTIFENGDYCNRRDSRLLLFRFSVFISSRAE